MKPLSESELAERLGKLAAWKTDTGMLVRDFHFPDFRTAMVFVNRLAEEAEARQHHPDIDIRYNRVRIGLSTHDAGGITEKDTALASFADSAAAR